MENTVKKKKKKSSRPSSANRRRREELLLSLMSEPLREIAEEAAEEMREYVRVKLVRYFTTEKIEEKVYYGRKQYEYVPVTDMTALEHYLKTIFVRTGHIGKDYVAELILNRKKPGYVFLKEVRRIRPDFAQKYDPIWKDAGEELMAFVDPMQCINDACKLFDRARIMELLAQNPHTKQMLKEMGLVRQEVVDRVPERYVDLYPECRKMMRHFVLHIGPTNSGKTYQAIKALEKAGSGVYLGPLRLLAYEQYERINADGESCSLLTGEERIEKEDAFFTASTIEMADLDRFYVAAVIDEAQMVEDRERGGAWTAAILGLRAAEIHICASLNAEKILVRMIEECGDTYEVMYHERKTQLIPESKCFSFPKDVKKGDALIVFSRKDVHAVASEMKRRGRKCSLIYGALPYDVRHEQAALFASGENEVVAATDAIGMGMNLPIRRVVFLVRDKFDGKMHRYLHTDEYKQIAGRAGRLGLYEKGYAACVDEPERLREALRRKDKTIKKAVIAFPRTLLGIDAPLSAIIRQWIEADSSAGYVKAVALRELMLAREMEADGIDDKEFIYRFITMPFDERDDDLHATFSEMYRREWSGRHYDIRSRLVSELPETLKELEHLYRLYDLLYVYGSRYGEEEALTELFDMKNVVSEKIMELLAAEKFETARDWHKF